VNKEEINNLIAEKVGFRAPRMSTGSTESRDLFIRVNAYLGLGLSPRLTKPEMARATVEASGATWGPDSESRGGTVTRIGLLKVLEAVEFFLA
jgi:hypothetical protein